jgi:hypothetical protein
MAEQVTAPTPLTWHLPAGTLDYEPLTGELIHTERLGPDEYGASVTLVTLDAARATDVELREAAAHLLDVWPMPKAREAARLALHAALEKDR